MEDKYLPFSRTTVHVNTSGARIVETEDDHPSNTAAAAAAGPSSSSSSSTSSLTSSTSSCPTTTWSPSGVSLSLSSESGSRDSSDIYLPKHTEWISHIALDIGGSLAKVVYFSRAPKNGSCANGNAKGKARESPTATATATASGEAENQTTGTTMLGDDDGNGNGSNTHTNINNSGSVTPTTDGTSNHHHHHNHNHPTAGTSSPRLHKFDIASSIKSASAGHSRPASPGRTTPVPNGVLGPDSIASASALSSYFDRASHTKPSRRRDIDHHAASSSSSSAVTGHATSSSSSSSRPAGSSSSSAASRPSRPRNVTSRHTRRSSSLAPIPGGWLNFTKFETGDMDSCIDFLNQLIESSASSHDIPASEFKARHVKIMATGGGAHLFYDRLSEELGVEVRKEEEMECLITGLTFFMEIPHEVFWYSDQLIDTISHPYPPHTPLPSSLVPPSPVNGNIDLPRPSPNPPQYALVFDENPVPQFPCMLVNIGSGVSIIKVDDYGKYERISGTSLGGGTLWGLLSLLTGAESFDEMLALSEQGDNANVDMLVGDIYGSDYSKIGLKSSTIASTFGKVFRKGGNQGKKFRPEDISKSLLYAISNNIGQIAYMNAEKHNLDRIYFGGCFIRGHAATISTLSYAIRFWSKGTKKALFLRHEGYLGSIGAWLRNIEEEDTRR